MNQLPIDLWIVVMNLVVASSDAAALACTCQTASHAYRLSQAFRKVRISRFSGSVHEPASGTFDAEVDPNDCLSMRRAIDMCPPGGSILVRPGDHRVRLELLHTDTLVHIFGRGEAHVASAMILAPEASLVGLCGMIMIRVGRGRARVQQCIFARNAITVCNDGGDPTFERCQLNGFTIYGEGTRGRFVNNTFKNTMIHVSVDAAPTFTGNVMHSAAIIIDHASGTFIDNVIHGGPPLRTGFFLNRSTCVIERNTISDCEIALRMVYDSRSTFFGNRLCDNDHAVMMDASCRGTFLDNRDSHDSHDSHDNWWCTAMFVGIVAFGAFASMVILRSRRLMERMSFWCTPQKRC